MNFETAAPTVHRHLDQPDRSPRCWAGLLLALLALVATSCSSTKIQSQRNPAVTGPVTARHLMVLAMDERPQMRSQFENQFVKQWKVPGVECTASYERFPLAAFAGDRETIRQKLAAAGAETLLVVRVTDRDSALEGTGVHAADFVGALFAGELTMGDVDQARYRAFTSQGEISTSLVLRGRLFRVSDGALLWTSFTQYKLAEDYKPDAVFREVAGTIASRLAQDKLFP